MKRLACMIWNRFWLVCLLIGLQAIYFPLNHLGSNGIATHIFLDQLIPVWPVWTIPYILWQLWWPACFLWLVYNRSDAEFRHFFITAFATITIAMLTFWFFPTYVVRTLPENSDLFADMLTWIYEHDKPYNALPSAHMYITTMITLMWTRWYPRQKPLWLTIFWLILFSTLFTGQHYILDVMAGILLPVTVYYISGLYLERRAYFQTERTVTSMESGSY